MDCAMESDRTTGSYPLDGIPPGKLVAKAGFATAMIRPRRDHGASLEPRQCNADARRIVSAHPGAQAGCAGTDRSTKQAPYYRAVAKATDLCAGRPRNLGARGALHRVRPAGAFGDCRAIAQHGRIRADLAGGPSRRPRGRRATTAVAAGRTGRGP